MARRQSNPETRFERLVLQLPREDLATIDRLVEENGATTRSALCRQALQRWLAAMTREEAANG